MVRIVRSINFSSLWAGTTTPTLHARCIKASLDLVELVPFSFVQQRQAAGPEFPPPLLFCGKEIGFGKLLEEVYPKGDMRNFQFPEIFYQSFAGRRTGKKKEKGVPEARGTLILAPISSPAPKAAKFKKAHIPERS